MGGLVAGKWVSVRIVVSCSLSRLTVTVGAQPIASVALESLTTFPLTRMDVGPVFATHNKRSLVIDFDDVVVEPSLTADGGSVVALRRSEGRRAFDTAAVSRVLPAVRIRAQ